MKGGVFKYVSFGVEFVYGFMNWLSKTVVVVQQYGLSMNK